MDVIAIDGPAGSGKSTVARAVAARLGWSYLDTGAMYRSVTLALLERGGDPADADAAVEVAKSIVIDLDGGRVRVGGADVSRTIRGPEVSAAVSTVAAHPLVRGEMVKRQRAWASSCEAGCVIEGRDIGTVVFPDARLKVFLTASEEERIRRRTVESGEAVAAEVVRRDRVDSSRGVSPLVAAPDALVVDTTGRTVDDVVEEVLSKL